MPKNKNGRITLTQARVDALKSERDRTRIGSYALLDNAPDAPEDLTFQAIERWLRDGAETAPRRHYEWVLDRYAKLPDCPYEPISDAQRQALCTIMQTKGAFWSELYRALDSPPEGVCEKKVRALALGDIKSARIGLVEKLMDAAASLPDNSVSRAEPPPLDLPRRYLRAKPIRRKSDLVPITSEMRNQLLSELERTGVPFVSLARACSEETQSVTALKISLWKSGRVRQADPSAWEALMKTLNTLHDIENK